MLPAPPTALPLERHAMFLDLDGTLLDYAPQPGAVTADAPLLSLLETLSQRLEGALALVSGRSIDTLDQLFRPLRLASSGLHGFERRDASGNRTQHAPPSEQALSRARRLLRDLAAQDPGLRLEDKRFALALHFRQAPQLEAMVVEATRAIAAQIDDGLEVVFGPKVVELSPRGVSKASAIAEFMQEAPFAGRRPLFVGDDAGDEPAFEWVNGAGGLSVVVNPAGPSAAATRLRSVREVRTWLAGLAGAPA
ncbi:MAG TPA: trehalose-phosphatase [Steroidobacteraceae bacterium]|nr:trehalose-phosphatase [Steroidobacteraceae bacterium]